MFSKENLQIKLYHRKLQQTLYIVVFKFDNGIEVIFPCLSLNEVEEIASSYIENNPYLISRELVWYGIITYRFTDAEIAYIDTIKRFMEMWRVHGRNYNMFPNRFSVKTLYQEKRPNVWWLNNF